MPIAGGAHLAAFLDVPPQARGIAIFAHGSGSSRHSGRNKFVAQQLQNAGIATLLMDLLTPAEEALDERTRALRFDIALLARRVEDATRWIRAQPETRALSIGYFGASTGAAAALVAAAADEEHVVRAVVSRGGRPDLAGSALPRVRAATRLIVGSADTAVLRMNSEAAAHLTAEHDVQIVKGASHLFEEPGALERVAQLAVEWFTLWL